MDRHLETRVLVGDSVQLHARQPDAADLSYMLLWTYCDINCSIPGGKLQNPHVIFILIKMNLLISTNNVNKPWQTIAQVFI